MSSSLSELDSGSGMESVGMIFTWGLPCSLWKNVSFYHMGKQGDSCLLLAVDITDWPLVLSVSADYLLVSTASDSESESKELGLCNEDVIVGDDSSEGAVSWWSDVICGLPFKEIRCANNLFKHIPAIGRGPEMGLDWALDGFV